MCRKADRSLMQYFCRQVTDGQQILMCIFVNAQRKLKTGLCWGVDSDTLKKVGPESWGLTQTRNAPYSEGRKKKNTLISVSPLQVPSTRQKAKMFTSKNNVRRVIPILVLSLTTMASNNTRNLNNKAYINDTASPDVKDKDV